MSVEGNVTITPAQGTPPYEDGAVVDITANPDEGWYLVGWTGHHMGKEEVITLTMDNHQAEETRIGVI